MTGKEGTPYQIIYRTEQNLHSAARETLRDQISYLLEEINDVSDTGEALTVSLSKPIDGVTEAKLFEAIDELAARITRSFSKVRADVVAQNDGVGTFAEDPMKALKDSRQAIESFPGTFIIRGDLLRVITGIDQFFRAYALERGGEEQSYPTTVPLNSMVQNGYMTNFPHHVLTVSRVHAELPDLARIANIADSDNVPNDALVGAGQMLAPTVCYHCFEIMRGLDLAETGRCFTATARCHRNEGAATTGLSRLQTFNMREIVFFGSPDEVGEQKQQILEDAEKLFVRWGVGFAILTATDPFFAIQTETKRTFQSLQALKHELRIKLPYDSSTIACASFNNHKDTLVKSYGITASGEDRVASGCVGYGFERMALGLFAQFGMDLSAWPDELRGDLAL